MEPILSRELTSANSDRQVEVLMDQISEVRKIMEVGGQAVCTVPEN